MYIVSAIFDHTAPNMTDARAMASTASHAYDITVDILDGETGEVLATYQNGHPVQDV